MAKKCYEVVEKESGIEVDFLILDKEVCPERMSIIMGLGDKYELRLVKKDDGVLDKLTEWYNLYRDEVQGIDKEVIGTVGVDSGMLMITDPCYVKEATEDKCEEIYKSTKKRKAGQILNSYAMALQTAYGDGLYDVLAKKDEDGRITSIEIKFG